MERWWRACEDFLQYPDNQAAQARTPLTKAKVTSPFIRLWCFITSALRAILFTWRTPAHLHPRCAWHTIRDSRIAGTKTNVNWGPQSWESKSHATPHTTPSRPLCQQNHRGWRSPETARCTVEHLNHVQVHWNWSRPHLTQTIFFSGGPFWIWGCFLKINLNKRSKKQCDWNRFSQYLFSEGVDTWRDGAINANAGRAAQATHRTRAT